MKEMIQWQRDTELLAHHVYHDVAEKFKSEQAFADFVHQLSLDERGHARIMEKALALFEEKEEFPQSNLLLDDATKQRVLQPIEACKQALTSNTASIETILDCIIQAEFSEWNDLFIYIIKTCQQFSPDFQKSAAVIQHHKQRIEEFLATSEFDTSSLKALPEVWEARFLIVDDEPIIRFFLEEVLSERATVETAENGKEALEKAQNSYFDLIISDVDMPFLDGLGFFSALSTNDPDLSKRFILSTGNPREEVHTFCQQNNIDFLLPKPFPLHQLNELVEKIMKQQLEQE